MLMLLAIAIISLLQINAFNPVNSNAQLKIRKKLRLNFLEVATEETITREQLQVQLCIREAKFNDLSSVVNLRVAVFYPDHKSLSTFHTLILQKIRKRMEAGSVCLLAHSSDESNKSGTMIYGKLLGTVEFSASDFINTAMEDFGSSRKIYVADLAVRQDVRRMGVASRLLERIESYCHDNNFYEIFLHVESDNSIARQLYAALGYHVIPSCEKVISFTEARLLKSADPFVLLRKTLF